MTTTRRAEQTATPIARLRRQDRKRNAQTLAAWSMAAAASSPDETVSPRLISPLQQRVTDPVFAFALELIAGRVQFDAYKVQRPIQLQHDLQAADFPMTDALFKAFKDLLWHQSPSLR